MRVTPTKLDGVLLIEPRVFEDDRGFFLETYQRERYRQAGVPFDFVQDNRSRSNNGVLRGLHYQEPMAQGKLIYVVQGSIFDVVVDVRYGSPTFGEWFGAELNAENCLQMWIPPGFAHGYLTLKDSTDVIYKCTDYYADRNEHILLWNDPAIAIEWPVLDSEPRLSAKDAAGLRLDELLTLPH
jgi:dTDP-4-dehydrorhamnose 3,5-epimerase